MNNIKSIYDTELFEKLKNNYDCVVSYNCKTLYEGRFNDELDLNESYDPSCVVVEFLINEQSAMFTLTENTSIKKLKELFEGREFEELKTDAKLYNSAMMLANNLPALNFTFDEADNADIRKYGANYRKLLENYIMLLVSEATDEAQKKTTERGEIKFTIWTEPDTKVKWLEEGESFQKIEYKYENKEKGIKIDFLLGQEGEDWKLWAGKVGSTSYDDDPYCDLDTTEFKYAIINALDKVEEIIKDVKENPDNWVQFYIEL